AGEDVRWLRPFLCRAIPAGATKALPQALIDHFRGEAQRRGSSQRGEGWSPTQTDALVSGLLRDIFGDPLSPWRPRPEWLADNDGAARQLAEQIEAGSYADLPILGDALEDAGCADRAVLDHCRGQGTHALGCWVIEAVLGR